MEIVRRVHLPVSADEAWSSLADADGLAAWLGDEVDLEVVPGAAGIVVDRGVRRRVVLTEVAEAERVAFAWWSEDAPAAASTVTIELDEDADGEGTTVVVRESLVGASAALAGRQLAAVTDLDVLGAEVLGAAWDGRLGALLGGVGGRVPALVG